MQYARPLLIVALVAPVLVPALAFAGGRGHHGGVVVVAPRGSVVVVRPSPVLVHPVPRFVQPTSVFPTVIDPWRFWGVSNFVFPRPFFSSSLSPFIASSPFFASSPFVASVPAGAIYTSTLVGYSQPAPMAIPVPASLPTPALIEYPTGWYQLRGDGVATPYVWVWIPKPPPPPSEAPPTMPPAPPSIAPPAPSGQQRPSAPRGELYSWTDEQGAVHWTDRLDRIPQRYRSQVQRLS